MNLISCKNLTMAYDNNIALENVTFDINEGDYISIVGENGSGKSTLLKGLLKLLEPKSGIIEFNNGLKSTEIGYLPQQTVVQRDFPASVFEIVLSGCLNKKGLSPFYSLKDKRRAVNNIKKLGIEEIQQKCYRDLSGGQQQRVLLARALCATEKILLLDEPVTGLDPIVTMELYDMIKKLNKEDGVTIIMVSHDITSAVKSSDKILHMDKGIRFYGTVKDYIKSDASNGFLGGCINV
ncbi:metal ABC transporter ATP-binding protein [Clostridium culturomicium]|uniref:metal ABC transporter ATP-binding protein n=1 Tax=Clostridium culturomicium TaxID=1499683 RepID=UPI0038577E45